MRGEPSQPTRVFRQPNAMHRWDTLFTPPDAVWAWFESESVRVGRLEHHTKSNERNQESLPAMTDVETSAMGVASSGEDKLRDDGSCGGLLGETDGTVEAGEGCRMATSGAKSATDRPGPFEKSDRYGTGLELTRRSSSIGISLMTECIDTSERSIPPVQMGKTFMMDASGAPTCLPTPPSASLPAAASTNLPYRPMVGAGAAAAFEALRHDFYVQKQKREQQHKRRMSSLSMGSAKGRHQWKPVHPEEQYEMLKLHHLNLMNEIQETELMLNLYEQQQLVEEQRAKMRQIQMMQFDMSNERGQHAISAVQRGPRDNREREQKLRVPSLIIAAREVGSHQQAFAESGTLAKRSLPEQNDDPPKKRQKTQD